MSKLNELIDLYRIFKSKSRVFTIILLNNIRTHYTNRMSFDVIKNLKYIQKLDTKNN